MNNQFAHGIQEFFTDTAGSRDAIFGDEFPNLGYVLRGARVKLKSLARTHFEGRRLNSSASRFRKSSKNSSPSTHDAPALDLVIAAIEHVAHFGYLGLICSHRIFHEIVRRAAAFRGKLI